MSDRKSRPWRLGLDLGTNSLGWCAFDLAKGEDGRQHPVGIRRMGVRIYTDGRDPQSGASLAQERRGPRGARRRRDRYLDRRADLLKALIRHGLMPADPAARKQLEELDPWPLRGEGLDRALTLHELGRAIFHLNQRRGFKSNRKADRGRDDKEAKDAQDMKAAAKKLDAVIGPDHKDARTLGEYLYKKHRATFDGTAWQPITPAKAETVRSRPTTVKGRNAYEFYPLRSMIAAEFDALWTAQAAHHQELTDAARDEIRDIVFHQRPLRPVDPGPCTLDPEENLDKRDRRAPLALPIQQDFRILQELANLELFHKTNPGIRRRLTLAERDALYAALRRSEKVTFKRIRILLKVEAIWSFNLENDRRDHLKGDIVAVRLGRHDAFGKRWLDGLTDVERQNIVLKLLEEENPDEAIRIGVEVWGLTPGEAEKVADTGLPVGYGSLGLKALDRIVPILRERAGSSGGPIRYDEAVQAAGYHHHSDFRDGELLDALPYYGEALQRYTAPVRSDSAPELEREFGRLANPTVHIGLNQLRKLVNALTEKYGPPEEIVVELARDLKRTQEQRDEIQKMQSENQKKNDGRREIIDSLQRNEPGWKPPRDAMLRLRLWEELDPGNVVNRRCVYSGKAISRRMLFSDEVEIEHILPFTQSLDDSPSNLTVSLRSANRIKGNLIPHAAFGHGPSGYDWDEIMLRVAALPRGKQWRFRADAIDLIKDKMARETARLEGALPADALDDIEKTGGFLARQLVDTAYLARVTRQYLWKICDPNKTWVIPGQMTALLRRKWGLNSLFPGEHNRKYRGDHRHHAIDAYVIGLTDRSMLQGIQAAAAGMTRERLVNDMPDPWDGYRDQLKAALDRIVVSHRPDHGIDPKADAGTRRSTSGKLHEETAYGIVKEPEREGGNVVARKPLESLSENEIDRIRDVELREKLRAHLAPYLPDGQSMDNAKARLAAARKAKDSRAVERAQAEIGRLKVENKTRKKAGAKDFKAALAEFGRANGIRRVRLVKPEAALVVVRDRFGVPYKAYSAGDNLRVEIFERADGSWGREIVTAFDANRVDFRARWRAVTPEPCLKWLVHKNDLVRLDVEGEERVMRVVSIWDKYLQLAGHTETALAERYRDGEFKWTFGNYDRLKELKFRRVTVSPFGELRDPAKTP
ncbi:MAG: type II CRISPR RNA-guided endonuclease Cas9 [Rhodospirillales bacterium]|nr:type II CRISPR RNA-guided endonuclease Cas9 [Rhodospirillales bacterium]